MTVAEEASPTKSRTEGEEEVRPKTTYAEVVKGSDAKHGEAHVSTAAADYPTAHDITASELGVDIESVLLLQMPLPQLEGGNLTVTVDEEEYSKGIDANKFSLIGRYVVQKEQTMNTLGLKAKLAEIWGVEKFHLPYALLLQG